MKEKIMGVAFDNVSKEEAVAIGCKYMVSENTDYVVTPNAEIVYAAQNNNDLMNVLNHASMVLPDGVGVIYASKLLHHPLKEKVAGIEFGTAMIAKCAENNWKLFLLGAKPGVAEKAADKLQKDYSGLIIAGTNDGYFTDDDIVAKKIRESKADLVLVCLGAPKQEFWMAKHGEATGAKLLCGLGGSLDIFAGISERAPDIWVKLGMEWAYRLVKEPWRIKRQLSLPKFIFAIIGEKIAKKHDHKLGLRN